MVRPLSMSQGLPDEAPPRDPHVAGGGREGNPQMPLKLSATTSISEQLKGVYAALQKGVEAFGGVVSLAAAIGKNHGEVGRRVRREQDDKGDLQRAFLDYVAALGTDWKARHEFLSALCAWWGYKQPEPLKEPTVEEKYRALMAVLRGELGDSIKDKAAEIGGFDSGSFSR